MDAPSLDLRVLVIEDDPDLCTLVEVALSGLGAVTTVHMRRGGARRSG